MVTRDSTIYTHYGAIYDEEKNYIIYKKEVHWSVEKLQCKMYNIETERVATLKLKFQSDHRCVCEYIYEPQNKRKTRAKILYEREGKTELETTWINWHDI